MKLCAQDACRLGSLMVCLTILGCSVLPSQGNKKRERANSQFVTVPNPEEKGSEELSKPDENTPDSFFLKSKHSSKCLEVGPANTLVQEECNGSAAQEWIIVKFDEGDFDLRSVASGKCLASNEPSPKDGTAIVAVECNSDATTQRWVYNPAGEGYVDVKLAKNDLCFDVLNQSVSSGAAVALWSCSQHDNQLWLQEPARPVSPDKTETSEPAESVNALACSEEPKVEFLTKENEYDWKLGMYGGNYWYANFFTPVAQAKGKVYWIWVNADRRVKISMMTDGQVQTVDLAARYRALEDPHNVFSLGLDKNGYIHVAGDMHNGPSDSTSDIQERGGEYPQDYSGARSLYWRSKKPHSVSDGFEFLGKSAQAIPVRAVNGIRFFTDSRGELYASATVRALEVKHRSGLLGIGLYRYNAGKGTWQALGNIPDDQGADVTQRYPVLFWDYGGVKASKPPSGWFQGFFSYFRFDSNDGLHFATSVNTNPQLEYHNQIVYAKSDDYGVSWKKAGNAPIAKLPVRAAGDQAHRGDIVDGNGDFDWQNSVVADGLGRPGILQRMWGGGDLWYTWDGSQWVTTSKLSNLKPIPQSGHFGPKGSTLLVRNQKPITLYCQKSFDDAAKGFTINGYDWLVNIDDTTFRHEGVIYGVVVNMASEEQRVVKITYKTMP